MTVISGKDKGKSGKVLRTFAAADKVLVESINMATRHEKARQRGSQGQIVEKPMPIHVSNVALVDKKTKKPARIGYTFEGEGKDRKKVRITRPSGDKA